MRICNKHWFLPLIIMAIVSLTSHQAYSEPSLEVDSASKIYLTEQDVRRIVRDELLRNTNVNVEEKQNLSSLLEQYNLVTEDANSLKYGNSEARFTLEMYSDIECPFCRQMYFDVKKVVDFSNGVINWEYKHFPLQMHNPVAAVEAQAIACIAQEQGNAKAWVALEQIIKATQGNGKGLNQNMPDFVRSFGLNGSLLKNCLLLDEPKRRVNEDYNDGMKIGISSTPALLLKDNFNGKEYLIKGKKTSEQLLQAIQSIM